jgi:SET domain-containing protein 6
MSETLTPSNIPEMQKTEDLKKVLLKVLARRMAEYETSLEEDERLLSEIKRLSSEDLGLRKRMAVEVRVCEKRILEKARGGLRGGLLSRLGKDGKEIREGIS